MNRNFAKISVAIVALVLALAFCLTGCKIDDVAADLDNTKNEVSANKTDAAKALEEAVKALEAKIAANDADCAAEITALNAAIKAVKEAGEATDADLAAAEATLAAAIDAVRESLNQTKTELSDKITANEAKINAEVAALNAAIATAEAALKAADEANKAALETAIAEAKAELEAALAALKADVEKLTAYVDEAVAALQADIAAGDKELTSAIVELKNALALASGEAADADAALKAELEQAISDAVKAVIDVVEIADAALQAQVDANAADIAAANAALDAAKVALEEADAILKAELEEKIAALEETLSTEIENVKNTLQAQIDENAADIADAVEALEAAKVALETADATNRAELEGMIEALEEAVNGRIDEIEEALQAQIDGNAADIAAATQAIAEAKAALEAAQAADKTELAGKISALETAISDLETTLNDKIDDVKAELEEKIDGLNALLGDLGNNTTVIGSIAEINAAIEALGNTDAAVAEQIAAIEADIEALYGVIAEYRETTEEVVKAWHEILSTYNNWVECSVAYGVSAEDMAAVEAAYASAQVRLYRALTADEVVAIKDAFYTVIESVESGELEALYEIYNNLVAAENGLEAGEELAVIREALDAARVGLNARTEANLIVDGKVVNLYEKYDAACKVYTEQRIAAFTAEYQAIINNINEAKEYADIEAIDELIADFKAAVDAAAGETASEVGIPVADEVIALLNDNFVDLLMRTADKYLEISIVLVDNATVETIGEVEVTVTEALDKMEQERLTAMAALGIDVYGLGTKVAATRVSIVEKYIGYAEEGIAAAVVLEDLEDDWAAIEAITNKIVALEARGIDVAKLVEARDALISAYYAKYVDIYAANLTAEMNGYIDNLGAIFAEVTGNTTNIADIRADYFAFVDNRAFAEALHSDSEAVAALVAAEAAFVKVEEQYAALTALVAEAEEIAAILDDEAFATIEGANVEYLVIKDYRVAAEAWVAALDELYADFTTETNAEAYAAIRALIDEAKFEEIKTAFEAAIQNLVDIAKTLINKIDTINTDLRENGHHFEAIIDIEEAWDAFREWEQNAVDADGVGFIIAYVSNDAYTNENLNTVLVKIQTDYETFVAGAQYRWNEVYVGKYAQALVEGTAVLTYKDDLSAVRAWFEEYGIIDAAFVAEHGLGNIGTSEVEAKLAEREAELEALKAERAALVAALEAEGAAIQAEIDALDLITTDSADQLKAIRDAYVAWVADCVANEVVLADLDLTKLAEAEATLEDLYQQIENIKALVEALEIPTLGTDPAAPYFADAAAKDAYVAEVEAIKSALAIFEAANDGYRGNLEDELAKVEAANPDLYVSKYEAALNVYNTYLDACATVQDADVLAKMAEYLEQARAEIDAVGQVAVFAAANDFDALLDALCAFYEAKFGAVVVVYDAYVNACAGVDNDAILENMDKFLDEAVVEISDVETVAEGYEEVFDLTSELYSLKMDTTVVVYNEYVAAVEGVEDNTILAKMDTYFNEAISEINRSNKATNNYIAYIQQIGTNAGSKFEDIKNNIDIDGPICSHAYDNACDAECNICGAGREVPDHVYDNACDANCNVCDAEREVPDHVYDNACDANCNVCDAEREVPDHVYDNACDANCNVCDAEREVADHVYDNACDADCNECGAVREVPDHVYDNACDANCNVCDAEREVPDHVYDNACDANCNVCDAERVVPDHVYDNVCDADCNVCGDVREVEGHVYDNVCDSDCNNCGEIRDAGSHAYDNVCDAECNLCGTIRVAPHAYDNACDAECNECGEVREVPGHVYDNACDEFCNECGEGREVADHVDADLDGVCDECDLVQGSTAEWPLALELGWTTTPEFVAGTSLANPGIQTYFYTYTVENDGLLLVQGGENVSVLVNGEYVEAPVAVVAGDVVEIVVNAEMDEETWTIITDGVSFQANVALPGTQNNPFAFELGWTTTPEFVAGTSMMDPGIQTYYYKGEATADGLLIVDTMDAAVVIFVNGNVQLDADYNPATKVVVAAGDVIELNVENAEWTLDAVSFTAEIAAPGTENNPFELELGWTETPEFVAGTSLANPGVQTYFYTYTVENDGLLNVQGGENVSVLVNGEYVEAPVAVVAGDVVEIVVNAEMDEETWTIITDAVSFEVTVALPGTQNNPFDLEFAWTTTPEFVAGTSLADPGIQTYYYKGEATVGGIFSVDTLDAAIVIFVNGNVQLDEESNPATQVTVAAGDVIELHVQNAAWTLDAVTFNATLAAPGTQANPFVPALGTNTTPEFVAGTSLADPGISTYYYSFTAQGKGTFTVSTTDAVVTFYINGNVQLDAEYEPLAVVTVEVGDVVEIQVENQAGTTDAVSFSLAFDCEHKYEIAENGAPVCAYCGNSYASTFASGEDLYNRVVLGGNDLSSSLANGSLSYNEEGYITISGLTTNPDVGYGPDPGVDKVVAVPFGPTFDGEGAPVSQRYLVIRYRTDTANAQFKFVTWNVPTVVVFSAGTAGEWETAIVDLGDSSDTGERFDIRCNIDANTTDISHIATFATLEDAQAYLNLYNASIACEEHPGYKLSASGKVKCTECGLAVLTPVTYTAGSDIYYRATTFQVNISGITYTKTPCVNNGDYVTITGVGSTANALDPNNIFSVAQGGAYEGGIPVIQRYLVMRVRTNAEFNLMYVITYNGAAQQAWSNPVDLAAASKGEWVTIVVDLFGDASAGSRVDISLNLDSAEGTETDISHMVSFSTLEEAQAYANVMGNSIDGACPHYGYTTTITKNPTCAGAGEALLECSICGLQMTVPVEHTGGHSNVVTGAEYGLADGQVMCTVCGQVSTPVTYQAGADLYNAVDPTSQDYALVTGGAAGVTVTGTMGTNTHAYGTGANLKLTSGTEYGKYMVTVYKIANDAFLGVSVDDALASYVALPTATTWAVSNYAVGTTNAIGEPGTTGATGNTLELICNYGAMSSAVSLYGVVTFNSAAEAALYAEYLATVTPVLDLAFPG